MTIDSAYGDLVALTACGIRFHGSPGIAAAATWIENKLAEHSVSLTRQPVTVPGWHPGTVCRLMVTSPETEQIRAWPLLWSGPSQGAQTGRLIEQGREGLWGNSMVWRRFIIVNDDSNVIGYLLGRDTGPAAPQPLPSGSDYSAPHFAIGRDDSDRLSAWLANGITVTLEFELDSTNGGTATGDNLIVQFDGIYADPAAPLVLICAHYDTFWNTPGAYDNGSGTIALLHLATEWAKHPPRYRTRLIFFSGEEWHLSGSRAYVESLTAAQLDDIAYVLNIDGLGRGTFLEDFAAPEVFETKFSAAIRSYSEQTRPGLNVISRFPPPAGTDDAAFYAVGVPSGFITFNDFDRLHQPEDTPNLEIAANIDWAVGLTNYLLRTLDPPERATAPGLL